MIVSRSVDGIRHVPNSVVTVGTFDGMHLGHQAILNELLAHTRQRSARSVVVTFEPHPREVVRHESVKYLTSIEERLDVIEATGIDETLVVEFTYEFSRLSSQDFYQRYLVEHVGVAEVVVGYDHMFGKNRESGIDELHRIGKILGFSAVAVSPVSVDGRIVKSSAIRHLLEQGDVEVAATMLGRPYRLSGIVVRGDGRGKALGFPTANIELSTMKKVIPASGVYFARVQLAGRELFGMLNIGIRPTFGQSLKRMLEVNIFDIDQDLYGMELSIHFVKRLRPEIKFDSKDLLIAQLHQDRDQCMKYVAEFSHS